MRNMALGITSVAWNCFLTNLKDVKSLCFVENFGISAPERSSMEKNVCKIDFEQ